MVAVDYNLQMKIAPKLRVNFTFEIETINLYNSTKNITASPRLNYYSGYK